MKKYIFENIDKHRVEPKIFRTMIIIKDPLPDFVNLSNVINSIETMLPEVYFTGIDSIYIGKFEELEKNETNAMFFKGTMYIDNEQDNDKDLIDDITHEVAHNLEKIARSEIYGDNEIIKEFLAKRRKLFSILKNNGFNPPHNFEMELKWDENIDKFLYKDVTYAIMRKISNGLFVTPYGATSLREYFANGFESYYLGKINRVKTVTPAVYAAIERLEEITDEY